MQITKYYDIIYVYMHTKKTMEPFFLCFKLINNEVVWVPPAVLLNIASPYNFQDVCSFLKCILAPKMVYKVK